MAVAAGKVAPSLDFTGKGRPRIYPEGGAPTSSERTRQSEARRIAAGGRRLNVLISAEAAAAAERAKAPGETDVALVERLILVEAERLTR